MSRASNLAGFTTSITSTRNLNIGIVTASEYDIFGSSNTLTVGGLSVGVSTFSGIATHTAALFGTQASFTGIVTASGFVGNITGTATGLSGSPIISVSGVNNTGVSTITDLRLASVADKTTIVNGNSVSLVYNTGGGNVAICTNPTGPITLNITGIPTDSSFNNRAISFAVIAIQTATAYACTSVTLNGVSFGANASVGVQTHIAYPFGAVATGSTSGYDIFNFTGINTIGSAATMTNYKLISNVSGDYRRY